MKTTLSGHTTVKGNENGTKNLQFNIEIPEDYKIEKQEDWNYYENEQSVYCIIQKHQGAICVYEGSNFKGGGIGYRLYQHVYGRKNNSNITLCAWMCQSWDDYFDLSIYDIAENIAGGCPYYHRTFSEAYRIVETLVGKCVDHVISKLEATSLLPIKHLNEYNANRKFAKTFDGLGCLNLKICEEIESSLKKVIQRENRIIRKERKDLIKEYKRSI